MKVLPLPIVVSANTGINAAIIFTFAHCCHTTFISNGKPDRSNWFIFNKMQLWELII